MLYLEASASIVGDDGITIRGEPYRYGRGRVSLAIPSAMYVSVVMTESLAYPNRAEPSTQSFSLSAATTVRQLAALFTILLAAGVRTQFLLFAVY